MRRFLRALRKSEEGSAAVELAIVASTFAVMAGGVIDITTAFNRKVELEQALQRSLEKIMNTTTQTTPTQTIKDEVVAAISGIEPEDVTVDYLLECDDEIQPQSEVPETDTDSTEEPDASAGCDPTQVQRRYVSATVTDEFVPFFSNPKLGMLGTTFNISAKAGMRVE